MTEGTMIPFEQNLSDELKQNPAEMTADEFADAAFDIMRKLDDGQRLQEREDGSLKSLSWADYQDASEEERRGLLIDTIDRITAWAEQVPADSDAFADAVDLMLDVHESLNYTLRDLYLKEVYLRRAWAMADRAELTEEMMNRICQVLVNSEVTQSGQGGDRSHMNKVFEVIQNPANLFKLMEKAEFSYLPSFARLYHYEQGEASIMPHPEDRVEMPVYGEMFYHMATRLGDEERIRDLAI